MQSQALRHLLYRFRAWVSKKASASSHDQATSTNVFASLPKKKTCNTCSVSRSLFVILHLFFYNWVTATKKYSVALLPLKETALVFCRAWCRWQHYLQYGRFRVASTLLWCGELQFCGCSPSCLATSMKRTCGILILVWRCHRSIGGHKCGARLRAIDDRR